MVPVDLPKGRKTYEIPIAQAQKLWAPLIADFKKCAKESLKGTKYRFADITHPMLVGGSSRIPGLREALAEVMGRDPSEIVVCTDSEHVVSMGAAEHGYFQDEAKTSLETGLGLTIHDMNQGTERNLLLLEPGHILDANGTFVERTGNYILRTSGNSSAVASHPFVCKSGVRATVSEGRETFLEDSEIVPLKVIEQELIGFPSGEHDISIGVYADANRILHLLYRPTALPHVEPVSVRLQMSKGSAKPSHKSAGNFSVILVLDYSGSMSGQKIAQLKAGASSFSADAIARGSNIAVVVFGHDSSVPAETICEPTQDANAVAAAVNAFDAHGGTPMAEGLNLAVTMVKRAASRSIESNLAVLFTDGHPNSPEHATLTASELKKFARLIPVGIGNDVNRSFLASLATNPDDYRDAKTAANIIDAFDDIARIIWSPRSSKAKSNQTKRERTDASKPPSLPDASSDYGDDWSDIEVEELEVK